MKDSVSVIIPAYNEEGNLRRAVKNATAARSSVISTFEIIVVDDGSTDNTGLVADEIAKQNRQVTVIHLPNNCGVGAAYKTGLK